jgi:hypothetical protein
MSKMKSTGKFGSDFVIDRALKHEMQQVFNMRSQISDVESSAVHRAQLAHPVTAKNARAFHATRTVLHMVPPNTETSKALQLFGR